jgi:high-affinity nickel permease
VIVVNRAHTRVQRGFANYKTLYRTVTAPGPAGRVGSARQASGAFTHREWTCLAGLYGAVLVLHVCGWGFYLYYSPRYPTLPGLGFVAYMFGLRHAFDADHIAAVDDTVRYLQHDGQRPLAIGFWFSLGHATVVCALALGLVFAATEVGMLTTTAVASAGNVPLLVVMSLPLLFAAGMTVMDTTDGVLMTGRTTGRSSTRCAGCSATWRSLRCRYSSHWPWAASS